MEMRTHDGVRKIKMEDKNHPGGYDIRIKKPMENKDGGWESKI